jgi:hypothetical protein
MNINAASFPHWRAAMARVRAGTGRGTLLIVGDSTTMGAGAGTGGTTNLNAAWPKAWPRLMAKLLPTLGVPISDATLQGDQTSQVAYGTYDTRVTFGTGWLNTGGFATIGGH